MKKCKFLFVMLFLTLVFILNANAEEVQDLGQIIITATRIAQHDYKIAGNVTVIDREQIEASNAATVPDILKEALGVNVYSKSTSKSSTIDIRGFGDTAKSNVLVLVNDRKVNEADLSGADLIQIPIDAVERIEIIRGAGSVLYGDNAVGGVVNIITKHGEGKLSGKVGAFYGSYDAQGSDLEVSGEFKDVSYYISSRYFDERGYRQNSDVLSKDFNSRLGYKINDKVRLDLEVGRHEDTTDLPGGLDESELVSLGRSGSANNADVSTTKDTYYKLGFDINPWPENLELGRLAVNVMYRNRDVFDSFGGYDADRDNETLGVTAKYMFDKTIFDKEVSFVTGVDMYDIESDIKGSGSNSDDITISKEELGIYGFLEYELKDGIFINGGTRQHKANYSFDNIASSSYTDKGVDEWVSMGGVRWEYKDKSVFHFNVQQSFRFLATDEWYSTWSGLNTDLEQQSGIQFEVGAKHNFDDKVEVSVTPYYMNIDNEIFYNATSWQNENYDKTKRIGVEVGSKVDVLGFLDLAFLDKLEFFANYAYQSPEFAEGDYEGNDVPLVPRNQASTGLSARFLKNYNLTLMGRLVGSRYIINDLNNNMPKAKPYYVVDTKVSYKSDFFEVFLGIDNLFDEQYSPYQIRKTSTTRDYYPAEERNYNFGVNLKF